MFKSLFNDYQCVSIYNIHSTNIELFITKRKCVYYDVLLIDYTPYNAPVSEM